MIAMDAISMSGIRTAIFDAHAVPFTAVTAHFETGLTYRDAVFANGKGIFVLEIAGIAFIQINERTNGICLTEPVNGHCIMRRIQEKF